VSSDLHDRQPAAPRRVVTLAFPDVQSLDVTGPLEAFSGAARATRQPAYAIELIAGDGRPFTTSSGLTLTPHSSLRDCSGPIDTLLVAGGRGVAVARNDRATVEWLSAAARRSRRVASICTGTFLLAAAGLLDGRRATTHWRAVERLRSEHPAIDVEPDPIFVRDGNVYSSAGVTAGIDLALALIEEDHGPRLARDVARELVLFVRRPGGQAQFSAGLAAQAAARAPVRELQEWIPDHLDADLSVAKLAERAFMSPRNFARVFTREVGVTPAGYVEAMRLERARMLLETTELAIDEIARRCGFGTVETLRRTFGRRLHVSPGDYRSRFGPAATREAGRLGQVTPLRKAAG
jgi:transcriptional regulator GlxA family with amidase domain